MVSCTVPGRFPFIMADSHDTSATSAGPHRDLDRRSVLKLLGGTTLAGGTMIGTASADRSAFTGCRRVCTDTEGNFAVVATGDGYEGRRMDRKPRQRNVPWTHENTFCYEASRDEHVVGFVNENQVRGDVLTEDDCTLCLNPNDCASDYHDGGADVIATIDEGTIGACAGNLVMG